MKVLVFSDSHRYTPGMIEAIETHQPDQVIHLGDLLSDGEELARIYPMLPMVLVPGNCDGWTPEPAVRQFSLEGHTFLLSHGHLWGVKSGYGAAIAQARSAGADVLLFGHTHRADCLTTEDGILVVNPGSARHSYALLEVDAQKIIPTLFSMP